MNHSVRIKKSFRYSELDLVQVGMLAVVAQPCLARELWTYHIVYAPGGTVVRLKWLCLPLDGVRMIH